MKQQKCIHIQTKKINIANEGIRHCWSSSWYEQAKKGIYDQKSKQMGNQIEVTIRNC